MLISKPITAQSANLELIEQLYCDAFLPDARTPLKKLLHFAEKGTTRFLGWYDEDSLAGFSYTLCKDGLLFVAYLAVNGAVQSKGYGSRILQQLEEDNPHCALVLEVETTDGEHENSEQRARRTAFYLKNGFMHAGFKVLDTGITYDVLVKDGNCTPAQLAALYEYFSDPPEYPVSLPEFIA